MAAADLDSNRTSIAAPALLWELTESYNDWSEHAARARDAYAYWRDGPCEESRLRFAGFVAALDQEESAAADYRLIIGEINQRQLG